MKKKTSMKIFLKQLSINRKSLKLRFRKTWPNRAPARSPHFKTRDVKVSQNRTENDVFRGGTRSSTMMLL